MFSSLRELVGALTDFISSSVFFEDGGWLGVQNDGHVKDEK